MKKKLSIIAAMLLSGFTAFAQADDPVIMTINGKPVCRSEFEYSYNKNNSEGVIDKKSVEEYVDLFVNYKLKVEAALDERLDTLTSFKKEFAQYRDQQIRPTFVTDEDLEAEARKIYAQTREQIEPKGLYMAQHILLRVPQNAPQADLDAAKVRIDSIYNALNNGADFSELARTLSQDPGSASNDGKLPWLGPGQTVALFDSVAYVLKVGETCAPLKTDFGYHIIKLLDRKHIEPYDTLRDDIYRFMEARNVREGLAQQKIKEQVDKSEGTLTAQQLLDERSAELEAQDPEMRNLIREYHDGLLLFEISNRRVWEAAANDKAGLDNYFKKNKKRYKWDNPRFKGIAYHVKDKADVKAVKQSVKGLPFNKWADKLRTTFNNDSTIRIRVEKGIFKKGDNGLIDREIFKDAKAKVRTLSDYPIDAVTGKLLKAPEELDDVVGQVTADYQDSLEKEWVAELRRKYTVEVDKNVLSTVNKHE